MGPLAPDEPRGFCHLPRRHRTRTTERYRLIGYAQLRELLPDHTLETIVPFPQSAEPERIKQFLANRQTALHRFEMDRTLNSSHRPDLANSSDRTKTPAPTATIVLF